MFLALTFGAAVPVSVAFASWARRSRSAARRGLGGSYALALGAVAVVMTAPDAFTALFGWETLTLAFYLLAGVERNKPGRAAAAQVTFAFGKVSGAALLAGLLLLATRSHSIMLASFTHVPGGAVAHHRRGAAPRRVRGQGRPGAVPGLAAARLRRRAGPGPRDHGRRLRQRSLLRHVAHARAGGPGARLADRRAAGARRAERPARHRPRGGAEPALPGDRVLQHREHRAHRHRLRRRADRRGGRRPAAGRGGPAGCHAAGGRAYGGQVAAVHLVRRDRGRHRRRRPRGAARAGAAAPGGAGSGWPWAR